MRKTVCHSVLADLLHQNQNLTLMQKVIYLISVGSVARKMVNMTLHYNYCFAAAIEELITGSGGKQYYPFESKFQAFMLINSPRPLV